MGENSTKKKKLGLAGSLQSKGHQQKKLGLAVLAFGISREVSKSAERAPNLEGLLLTG